MSPALKRYYRGDSFESLARFLKTTENYARTKLSNERVELGLKPRSQVQGSAMYEFIHDRPIVLELYNNGMMVKEIAEKYGISNTAVHKYINKWQPKEEVKGETVKVTEFSQVWHELPDEFTIISRGKPVFKVVRI